MLSLLGPAAILLLALSVGVPLLTLIHELGHAAAAALLLRERVTVVQGRAPARVAFSFWLLDLRLRGPVAPHKGMVGWALWGSHPSVPKQALATLAGPLTSLASTFACLAVAADTASLLRLFFSVLALVALLQTLSSGLPLRYGRWFGQYAGEASDGLRTRRLLQRSPEPGPRIVL